MYGIVSIYNELNANLCDFDTKTLNGKVFFLYKEVLTIFIFPDRKEN